MERQEKPAILTLPSEVQTKILSHLTLSFGKSTIQAVLRTCKQLYMVALPISVVVFRNTVGHPKGHGPCSSVRNVQFLRYILIEKPWLAKYVKTVIFGRISQEDGQDNDDQLEHNRGSIASTELTLYERNIEFILGQLPSGYTKNWCTEWVGDLKRGTSDAQVALILLTCPNIQTLLFEMPDRARQFTRLLKFVRNLATVNVSINTPDSGWGDSHQPEMIIPLSKVQDVFHETIDYDNGYSEFCMEAPEFFTFPQLRVYECILAHRWGNVDGGFEALPRRSSAVEEITLHCSYIDKHTLSGMTHACRALKRFEFSHFRLNRKLGAPCLMMPRDIADAMRPHASTLECLHLNMEEVWDKQWDWVNCPERLYMGLGLRQMHMLKRLTIGMQTLTGMLGSDPDTPDPAAPKMPLRIEGAPRIVDCLPQNLEYLKICECGVAILDQAAELIREVEQGHRFKKLNYIGLLFNGWKMDPETDHLEVTKLTCNAAAVCLDVTLQDERLYLCRMGETICEPGPSQPEDPQRNMMSRIYCPHIRRMYRETRGEPDLILRDDPDLYGE